MKGKGERRCRGEQKTEARRSGKWERGLSETEGKNGKDETGRNIQIYKFEHFKLKIPPH